MSLTEKPQFGVSQYTTKPWSFEEDVAAYAEIGVDTVEVCEFKLDPARVAEQLGSICVRGMSISSVQTTMHTIYPDTLTPSPGDPDERVRTIAQSIDRIAPHVPAGTPFVLNTGVAPNGDFRTAYAKVVDGVRSLADTAAAHNIRLALEPLNPILMNTNSFLWSISQVLAMLDTIDRDNVGVCLDTWNIWLDPSVIPSIAACRGRILVTHISDWQLPRSLADRTIVGAGEIPTAALLRAIDSAGFDGPYTLEIFSDESLPDSLWKVDGRKVIDDSRRGFEAAWSVNRASS